jgi:hypothetical protein
MTGGVQYRLEPVFAFRAFGGDIVRIPVEAEDDFRRSEVSVAFGACPFRPIIFFFAADFPCQFLDERQAQGERLLVRKSLLEPCGQLRFLSKTEATTE